MIMHEITNPLIEGHEDDAINLIGDVLIGVKLRGFSGSSSRIND